MRGQQRLDEQTHDLFNAAFVAIHTEASDISEAHLSCLQLSVYMLDNRLSSMLLMHACTGG